MEMESSSLPTSVGDECLFAAALTASIAAGAATIAFFAMVLALAINHC